MFTFVFALCSDQRALIYIIFISISIFIDQHSLNDCRGDYGLRSPKNLKKTIIPSPTARTNGRTYATDYSVESVSLSDCDVCVVVVAKRCVRTVQQFVGSSGYSSLITIRSSASSG